MHCLNQGFTTNLAEKEDTSMCKLSNINEAHVHSPVLWEEKKHLQNMFFILTLKCNTNNTNQSAKAAFLLIICILAQVSEIRRCLLWLSHWADKSLPFQVQLIALNTLQLTSWN